MQRVGALPERLCFTGAGSVAADLGESPVFDQNACCVWWVDCAGKALFRTDWKTGVTRSWDTPEYPGFVVLTGVNGIAVGMETGIFLFNEDEAVFWRVIPINAPGFRFNDACVDPAGVLWAGIQKLDATEAAGALFRVTQSGELAVIDTGLTFPNGLSFDAVRARMYYSDSHASAQKVWVEAWPIPAASGVTRMVFADFSGIEGRPDGSAMDQNGNYWIAVVDGASLLVFSPDGYILKRYQVPVENPTKIAFGGDENRSVIVTSKGGKSPSGSLIFAEINADSSVRGCPAFRWNVPADAMKSYAPDSKGIEPQ